MIITGSNKAAKEKVKEEIVAKEKEKVKEEDIVAECKNIKYKNVKGKNR